MGEHRPSRPAQVGARSLTRADFPTTVRVRPDVAAIGRDFDYRVPADWSERPDVDLTVGSRVRIDLHGRRVGGWVVDCDPESPLDLELLPLRKWSGLGPTAEIVDLANWVAWRWAGSPVKALRTASPPRNIYQRAPAARAEWGGEVEPWAASCFDRPVALARIAPARDRWPLVLAALAKGNPLLLLPTLEEVRQLVERLRRLGVPAAAMPDDWSTAASGTAVVGSRAAALAPTRDLGAIVVFDEHDDAYREERTPTWHARDVAIERARRAAVPCVLVSPTPSLAATAHVDQIEIDRTAEHAGWASIVVVDRRDEPPGRNGLFAPDVVPHLRAEGRVACVLNRTGRVRILACVNCGEVGSCATCEATVRLVDRSELVCDRCGARRPPVCASCGATRLKNLVLGVGRAREELASLLDEPVGEVTASTADDVDARVVIGTEALLRRPATGPNRWSRIVFLDFDQHLTALRQQAESDALALLALAARRVGPRRKEGAVVIQTRRADHPVITAAVRANVGPVIDELVERARAMRWPPAVAQAEISGSGAPAFVDRLSTPLGIDVVGPRDGAWLVRADDNATLLGALARVDRGDQRLRIAVE